MTTRRRVLAISLAALMAAPMATGPALAQNGPLPVVATFSILKDMTERVGGDHVEVTSIVGPDGDAHVYQPTPADARTLSDAAVLIENGLQFEGWLGRLAEAASFDGVRAVAADGIDAIAYDDHDHAGHDHEGHDHGAYDPHAWQSPQAAVVYVGNIADALIEADPDNAGDYRTNRDAYIRQIEAMDSEITDMLSALPEDRRTIVTSHDAFQYFAREFGLTFIAPQGISTESEASAQDVARLIEMIREENIHAVFVENVSDPRLLQQIADETGATIGGTLYPDALSGPDGPAPTYLDMMRHNAGTIAQSLGS